MNMKEKYYKYKKINRVTFHLSLISLILIIPSIIAKDLVFIIIFASSTIISTIIYFIYNRKYKEILASFAEKCPNCGNDIRKTEEENYYINGTMVDKITFDTNIDDNSKRIVKIIKYQCDNDEFEYAVVETYYFNKKNEMKLLNKKENIII